MKIYQVGIVPRTDKMLDGLDKAEIFYVEGETLEEAMSTAWKEGYSSLRKAWSFSIVEIGEKR